MELGVVGAEQAHSLQNYKTESLFYTDYVQLIWALHQGHCESNTHKSLKDDIQCPICYFNKYMTENMQSSDIAGAETFSTALMVVLVHPNKCALEDALAHITILQLSIFKKPLNEFISYRFPNKFNNSSS